MVEKVKKTDGKNDNRNLNKTLKEEIIDAVKRLFLDYERDGTDYERVQWELDYLVYPYIGSFLSSGELSREEGREIFEYCEKELKKLKKIKERQKSRGRE